MSEVGSATEAEQLVSAAESAGMVRLVNEMIGEARRTHASDIHIESNPGEAMTVIRFRRDGDLEPYLRLPARLRGPLVSRLKIMARLDIAERRRPQDGKIDFSEFGGQALELRVAVMPTHDGLEDVVLRLLESAKPLPLPQLGLQARDQDIIRGFSARSFGMVLAAGPTGSGKTTTLHSMLAEYMEGGELGRDEAAARLLSAADVPDAGSIRIRRPVGCEHCKGKGYRGRIGIYEVLQNSRAVRQLIQDRARPSQIFDAAVREGMRSLRHDALEKVVQGRIDLKQARSAYR